MSALAHSKALINSNYSEIIYRDLKMLNSNWDMSILRFLTIHECVRKVCNMLWCYPDCDSVDLAFSEDFRNDY